MDPQSITPGSPIPKSNNCKAYWSEPQAQLRSLRTEKARRRLHEFVCQAWPVLEPETPFVAGIHVDAICEHLQAITEGRLRNLIINVPPGHAKSLLVAVFWPAWVWIDHPETRWLFSSYSATLAIRDSVKCRRLLESGWYRERWGDRFELSGDQNQKMRFENTATGYRIATSVGGAATGERADIVVVDDPHSVAQAASDAERKSAVEWWNGTMSTRINDFALGHKVVIQQRLHEADLTGDLIQKGGYELLMLAAEFEPERACSTSIGWADPRQEYSELLWPEKVTRMDLEGLKVALGSYRYAGQYQQRPAPAEGGIFERSWWRYWRPRYMELPPVSVRLADGTYQDVHSVVLPERFDRMIQSWDLAFKELKTSDYVCGGVWGAIKADRDLSQNFDDPQFVGPQRLNAFYDGDGLRFFVFDSGAQVTFSGISTDTVSHETGHALLDVLRPEFFFSSRPEINAFHESFGDCAALLTALADQTQRTALLTESPDLGTGNFVEASSEYLSDAIRKQFGNVAPSRPRHGLNDFRWKLPATLPAGAFEDPPELLSAEAHSFSRVFTGCFYDTIRFIFERLPTKNQATLLQAAQTAGKLLVSAVRVTPEASRYFRAIGRAMILADQDANGGANREAIGKAFSRHNLPLGSASLFAPTMALAGPAPTVLKTKASLVASTAKDLRERIRAAPGAKLAVDAKNVFGSKMAEVVHQREVNLGGIDKRLKGVVAYAAESVMVGSAGPRAAVLGALPEPNDTVDEVETFVKSLMENDAIQMDKKPLAAVAAKKKHTLPTHVIRTKAGKKVLERVRYVCC